MRRRQPRREIRIAEEALAASPMLRKLAETAKERLAAFTDAERCGALAVTITGVIAAIDRDAITFAGEQEKASMRAMLLIAVDLTMLRSTWD